jgi:hypothetical protein
MNDASPQRPGQRPQGPQTPAPAPPPEVPQTRDELEALAAKRSELVHQLESVTDRREEVADQLEDADAAARPGLEARLQMLDERSVRLEREILQTDDAIAAAAASGVGNAPRHEEHIMVPPPSENFVSKEVLANALLAEAVAIVLVGILLYRSLLKRARQRFERGTPADSSRLEQLQHSVDAIAVEVERISEGQRYVTKALNEGMQPGVGAGAREEAMIPRKGA